MSERYARYTGLKVALHDHVLTITINAPPMNSPSPEAHDELGRVWADASADPAVRVVVITGAGDRAFSAGGNINGMVESYGNKGKWQTGMAEARALIVGALECTKPVIARINGHAMGMGASIALCADVTVMVEDAKIGDPHVNVGLAAGDGGALLWPILIGAVEARRHLLTGLPLSGKDAAAKGLITESVRREDLDSAVQRWIDSFLSKSPSALHTTKQAINLDIVAKAKAYMGEMLRLETKSWESPNHLEAASAIAEKRDASFIDE